MLVRSAKEGQLYCHSGHISMISGASRKASTSGLSPQHLGEVSDDSGRHFTDERTHSEVGRPQIAELLRN